MAAFGLATARGPGQGLLTHWLLLRACQKVPQLPEGRACLPAVGEDACPSATGTSIGPSWPCSPWPRPGGEQEVKPLGTSNNRSGRLPRFLVRAQLGEAGCVAGI